MEMTKNETKFIYAAIIIAVIIVIAGFYILMNQINNVRNDLKNLELTLALSQKEDQVISEATSTEEKEELVPKEEKIIVIPTAIIFDVLSSPILSPQTKITVTVESISKQEDGTLNVDIRAFTSEATAYSALQPQNFFELLDLGTGGTSQKPIKIEGAFQSIPPKSAVSGRIIFKIEPSKNTTILQISFDGTIKYYELRKTYKETVLG
jgi:cell division protein FtsL